MKRSIPIILLVLFFTFACNDSKDKKETDAVSEPATNNTSPQTVSTANILDIKVPESSDGELNEFFKAYTVHLNEYLAAVRENNKPRIKASFATEKKFRIQLLYLPARLEKEAPAEGEKYDSYRSKTANYENEIERSEYVKALYDEAIKTLGK